MRSNTRVFGRSMYYLNPRPLEYVTPIYDYQRVFPNMNIRMRGYSQFAPSPDVRSDCWRRGKLCQHAAEAWWEVRQRVEARPPLGTIQHTLLQKTRLSTTSNKNTVHGYIWTRLEGRLKKKRAFQNLTWHKAIIYRETTVTKVKVPNLSKEYPGYVGGHSGIFHKPQASL